LTVEQRLTALEVGLAETRKSICGLEKVIILRFDAASAALDIQTRELQRRLELLNGEADRLRMMQATYVPREVWERHGETLASELQTLVKARERDIGRISVIAGLVAVLMSIAVSVVSKLIAG